MMTSPNGNIFRVTGPLCGEFTGPGEFPTQRPVTRSFDVLFNLRLNKRLRKQPWGWWFETLLWSLWRHCNVRSSVISRLHRTRRVSVISHDTGLSCEASFFLCYFRKLLNKQSNWNAITLTVKQQIGIALLYFSKSKLTCRLQAYDYSTTIHHN